VQFWFSTIISLCLGNSRRQARMKANRKPYAIYQIATLAMTLMISSDLTIAICKFWVALLSVERVFTPSTQSVNTGVTLDTREYDDPALCTEP